MGGLVDPIAEADRLATPYPLSTAAMAKEMTDRQEAWLQSMLDALGMTAEEAAKVYEIQSHPVEVVLDGNTLRATQQVRLRRREVAREPHDHSTEYERQLCIARGRHYDDRMETHSGD